VFDVFDDWPFAGGPFSSSSSPMLRQHDFAPRVDIKERDDTIHIVADLPGVSKDNLKVSVTRNVLAIEGERKSEESKDEEHEGVKYHRQERTYGKFMRRFELPQGVEPKDINVKFTDGILNIDIPKPKAQQNKEDHVLDIGCGLKLLMRRK